MPFWYHIPVPPISEDNRLELRLTTWLVQEGDGFHSETCLAMIECSLGRFAILANGDGFVGAKLVSAGASLRVGDPIATAIANGEDIPYRQPYSLAERVTN